MNVETVKFKLAKTVTWGVVKNTKNEFSIPVYINNCRVRAKIEKLVKEHNLKNPLYGHGKKKTLYLKSRFLSEKQKKELLYSGKTHIKVEFETSGIFTSNDGINYLRFKVNKLERVFDPISPHKLMETKKIMKQLDDLAMKMFNEHS